MSARDDNRQTLQKVFISSTSEGMAEYRNAAINAVRSTERLPIVMEDFPATAAASIDVCVRKVRECDAFVLILGFRYGSVAEDGRSYVEHEYSAAEEIGLPLMVFMQADDAPVLPAMVDVGENRAKLDEFKKRLKKKHTISFFSNANDLKNLIERALVAEGERVSATPSHDGDELAAKKPVLVLRGDEAVRRYELFVLDPLRYSGSDAVLDLRVMGPVDNCLGRPWLAKAMGMLQGDCVRVPVMPNNMSAAGMIEHAVCDLFVDGDHLDWLVSSVANRGDTIRARVRFVARSLTELEHDPNRSSLVVGMVLLHGFSKGE